MAVARRLVIVLVVVAVEGYTTRSYDLDVPGSSPIRIIEADPGWDLHTAHPPQYLDPLRTNYNHRPDLEHRTLRPEIFSEEGNSDKLKRFLNSYAQTVKKGNEDVLTLDDKFVDIPSEEQHSKPEKSKSWNLLHFDTIPRVPEDQKAWVSMEAIPWSVSKISKWHGKPKKDKHPNANDRISSVSGEYGRPKPIRPLVTSYYGDPSIDADIDDGVDEEYYHRKPNYPRPSASYSHKVNLHATQQYGSKRPPFNENCNNPKHHHLHHFHAADPGDVHDEGESGGGIITDGQPPNFPEHEPGHRRRGVASEAPHPFKGDVLPPLADGRVNMTTSHGGLLQVDGTFQSVDDAQRQHAKRQKLKTRSPYHRPPKAAPPTKRKQQQQQKQHQVQYHLQNGDTTVAASASDPSTVLAAVGAGMIPAGMALLVPMAMSGKRRRRHIDLDYLTTSPYTDSVELTLPSSL